MLNQAIIGVTSFELGYYADSEGWIRLLGLQA